MTKSEPVVFVVDDDPAIRQALESLIRSVGLRVESFASAQEFRARQLADAPSCLILDIRMPGPSGLDVQRELGEQGLTLPIIFVTGHGDIPTTVKAMKAGAVEFLTKPFREQELLDAIQAAIERDREAAAVRAELTELRARYQALTPREQEVIALVAAGRLNKQIAAELGTSEITVKVHRGHLMRKMSADSLADLVRMAQRLGIPRPN